MLASKITALTPSTYVPGPNSFPKKLSINNLISTGSKRLTKVIMATGIDKIVSDRVKNTTLPLKLIISISLFQ